MNYQVADLHCDLLIFLKEPHRTAYQPEVRASIPQLRAGNVKTQVLAIYVPSGKGSSHLALRQYQIYKTLSSQYPDDFSVTPKESHIHVLLAIENGSGLVEEDDHLEKAFERIEMMEQEGAKPLYITLTWNTENRFGGGNCTKVGLKNDGKKMLDYLHEKNIAVDFSHTSDQLANDILNYIDKFQLKIPVLASHSNLRSIYDVPRNLPDEIAQEILRRKGIIGLNFIRSFIGPDSPNNMAKHLEHLIKLGGEKQVCFGADFFYIGDIPPEFRKPDEEYFFSDFGDASVYGKTLSMFKSQLGASDSLLKGISHENFFAYLKRT